MITFGVTTRYYGATNSRGARIRVASYRGRTFVPYSYDPSDAHEIAVREVFGADADIRLVCPSESGRGDVYLVTAEDNSVIG